MLQRLSDMQESRSYFGDPANRAARPLLPTIRQDQAHERHRRSGEAELHCLLHQNHPRLALRYAPFIPPASFLSRKLTCMMTRLPRMSHIQEEMHSLPPMLRVGNHMPRRRVAQLPRLPSSQIRVVQPGDSVSETKRSSADGRS